MKLSLISASILALGLLTSAGLAATMTDASAIKAIDLKSHHLTLADGKSFQLPASWRLHGFKVGQNVKVSYRDHMGSLRVIGLRHSA